MSVDRETLSVYDAKAADYAAHFDVGSPGGNLKRFMEMLPNGARVLDLGCGPGGAAMHMQAAGFDVVCVDASAEMVAIAASRGLNATQKTFDEISGEGIYDGIWANFSLLHAPRADLPRHFAALGSALRAGGAFHIGMKEGSTEARDALGRKYTYVTVGEVRGLMDSVGITAEHDNRFQEVGLSGSNDPCLIVQGRKHA